MKKPNIATLVKQVPGSSEVEVDPVTGIIKRSKISGKFNPYDLFALEAALQLKDKHGCHITVLSMGPAQAETTLKEGLAMGADKGVLLCDRRLAGSDVLATSRALANALRSSGQYQIIITGKQTTDGDTAQVGPEIAEIMNIPHICGVTHFEKIGEDAAEVIYTLGNTEYRAKVAYPFVAAVDKDINTPRLPSYTKMKGIKADDVRKVSVDDIGPAGEKYGVEGSATCVENIFPPVRSEEHIMYNEDETDLAQTLYDYLLRKKIVYGSGKAI